MKREDIYPAADGTGLYYSVEGEGPLDVVLCDGIGCNGFIWRYLRPMLLERARVIHMHMRGHGSSDQPADMEMVGIRHVADDWDGLLETLDCKDAIVLGHSMGVQVALELWHRHPHRVSGLALICGSYQNPIETFHDNDRLAKMLPLLRGATRLGGRAVAQIWKKAVSLPLAYNVAIATELHPDQIRRADFEPYLEHLASMNPQTFLAMLTEAGAHSAADYLGDIDVPVLVVAGDGDKFTPPRLSEEMASMIPGAECLMVEAATHTAPIEQPTLINLHIRRFVNRCAQKVGRLTPAG